MIEFKGQEVTLKETDGDVELRLDGRIIAFLSEGTNLLTIMWIDPDHQDRYPAIKFTGKDYVATEEN